MPSSGAVRCAPSRSGRSHPPARAPCRPPLPPCADARRGNSSSRGRRATPAGRRRCGGGGGIPFPVPRSPRHSNVDVRAPVRASGYGAGLRARCRCVAERATALKARVLHARAWNPSLAQCDVRWNQSLDSSETARACNTPLESRTLQLCLRRDSTSPDPESVVRTAGSNRGLQLACSGTYVLSFQQTNWIQTVARCGQTTCDW